MSLSHCCGGILAHSSLQNCFNSVTLEGFRAWTAFLRSCHSISIGFRSGLWLGHSKVFILFFFSHSEVDLLVCFGSLSCCRTQVREQMAGDSPSGFFGKQQNSWFHLSQQVFQVLKQQNSPRPSHYHHHILLLVWCSFSEMLCYFYGRCNGTHTFQKSLTFVSSVHRVFSQKSWGSSRCFLAKLRRAFMFFLLSSGFRLGTLPCRPFLPSLFLMVESWTLTLTEASEACSSLDVVVGSFVTSWMSHRCALGVILVSRPLLGRFSTVPCFCHLWIMALTVVRWSPKALEMAL